MAGDIVSPYGEEFSLRDGDKHDPDFRATRPQELFYAGKYDVRVEIDGNFYNGEIVSATDDGSEYGVSVSGLVGVKLFSGEQLLAWKYGEESIENREE